MVTQCTLDEMISIINNTNWYKAVISSKSFPEETSFGIELIGKECCLIINKNTYTYVTGFDSLNDTMVSMIYCPTYAKERKYLKQLVNEVIKKIQTEIDF